MIDDDTLGNLNGDVFTPGIVCTFFFETVDAFYDGMGFGSTGHRGDRSRINQPLGLLGYGGNESSHNSNLLPLHVRSLLEDTPTINENS